MFKIDFWFLLLLWGVFVASSTPAPAVIMLTPRKEYAFRFG